MIVELGEKLFIWVYSLKPFFIRSSTILVIFTYFIHRYL